jgi:hypothetical protein
MATKHRKEVTVTLDGISLSCRPTLAKIAEIEQRYGSAITLLRRLSDGSLGVTDLAALVAIMVKGTPGAPPAKEVPELVFQAGAYSFAEPVAEFIANAITTDEPAAEGASGN